MQTSCGIDTGDPQRAELTLALPAIAIRVLAGLDDRLLGSLVKLAARAVIALRFLEDFLVP